MLRAFLTGWRFTSRHWPLGLVLWLVGVGWGVVFAWVSGNWLSASLDASLATRDLLHDLDANVIVDLLFHHRESLRVVLITSGVIAALNLLLWFWLHAALVVAVQGREVVSLAPAFVGGVELAPLMARLFAIAAGVLTVFTAIVVGAAWWAIHATVAWPSEMVTYYLGAIGVLVWFLGNVALVAIHDHARLRAAATRCRALSAYWWAARFVLTGGENAYLLAFVLQLMAVMLWLFFQLTGAQIAVRGAVTLTAALLWGELALLLRMWLRVWFFAAQNDLQSFV